MYKGYKLSVEKVNYYVTENSDLKMSNAEYKKKYVKSSEVEYINKHVDIELTKKSLYSKECVKNDNV